MNNRKDIILKFLVGTFFLLIATGIFNIGVQADNVQAEEESSDEHVYRDEGEVTIVREGTGGLEQLEAIRVSEETLAEWNLSESSQNTSRAVSNDVAEFLSYGSDYGYQDMEKRSNSAARQNAYQQMERICMAFSTNGQDAGVRSIGNSSYFVAGNVDLSGYSVTENDLLETYFMFRNDNPQYFWLSNQVLYGSNSIIVITYDAYKTGSVRTAAMEEIVQTAKNVYQSKIDASDDRYHKVRKLHDTLIADIEYSSDTSIPTAHSIAGAMTSAKSAVCEGYAKVMQVMMNGYDIDNVYVTGDAGGGHAWNMVRMADGNYYWLDATWDDQKYEQFQHDYFLVGNKNFTDHKADLSTATGSSFLYDLPQVSEENYVYNQDIPVIKKGDLNGDGNIMMTDLIMCLYHTSGRKTLTGNAFLAADIDGNGVVKMNDLMKILHHVSGRDLIS